MPQARRRGGPVIYRFVLLGYLAYLAVCAGLYAFGIPPLKPASQDMLRFFILLAVGLPWTMAVLALPAVLSDFVHYANAEGFATLVQGLTFAAVAMNLVALNYSCEWGRAFRAADDVRPSRLP